MKPVLADTSYYIALLSEEDAYHEIAVGWSQQLLGRTVVTEYVLVELGNALSRSRYRDRYAPFVRDLLTDPTTVFIAASTVLFDHGIKLYAARPDQSWSMVDCISFHVMKQRRLKEALTTDRHFVQAGFRALLREGGRQ
jgi:predicted nucleic acid-binding protein